MEESRLKQEADSKKAGERMDTDTNQRNFICLFFNFFLNRKPVLSSNPEPAGFALAAVAAP